MQTQTAWATGFLTQLLLRHLQRRYPSQMQHVNPRSFFEGVEGYETLKDPQSLLMDRHAWLPEEVLREVLRTAERVSGRKEIAHEAALDYFSRSAEGGNQDAPSIFEIIARIFDDVRTVALCSDLWAGAYTTFMRLQAVVEDPAASDLIVLSQCDDRFHPLLSTHFMLKGNYEGFVRLYDFVEEVCLEEVFLQYRVRDIAGEFEGYRAEEDGRNLMIREGRKSRPAAVFQPIRLDRDAIPVLKTPLDLLGHGGSGAVESEKTISDGRIVRPRTDSEGRTVLQIFAPREAPQGRSDASGSALRVVQGGTLRSGGLEYTFRDGAIL